MRNKTRFAPRLGLAQSIPRLGPCAHVAYGIFYTPVDMNTWCNQRHDVPYVFPETSQSDPYIPSITTLNFPSPVLGTTVVSFTALQLHAPRAVHPAVEHLARKAVAAVRQRWKLDTWAPADFICSARI